MPTTRRSSSGVPPCAAHVFTARQEQSGSAEPTSESSPEQHSRWGATSWDPLHVSQETRNTRGRTCGQYSRQQIVLPVGIIHGNPCRERHRMRLRSLYPGDEVLQQHQRLGVSRAHMMILDRCRRGWGTSLVLGTVGDAQARVTSHVYQSSSRGGKGARRRPAGDGSMVRRTAGQFHATRAQSRLPMRENIFASRVTKSRRKTIRATEFGSTFS